MPPRVGRAKYDLFRAYEVIFVACALRALVDGKRIHEKRDGSVGRPPAKKRDLIKALVFLEYVRCPIAESTGVLMFYQAALGLTKVPRPRTLWKYRAKRSMARILKELQREAGEEAWMKETIAGVDSTGISHYKLNGTTRRKRRTHDKAHLVVGVRSLVIPESRFTRGTWQDGPEYESLVSAALPGSNVRATVEDKGYTGNPNATVTKQLGATPYMALKKNAIFRPHPTNAYESMVYFKTRFPARWRSITRWRVKVECANSAKKRRFGDLTRGSITSRRNREFIQDIAHNIRFNLLDQLAG